MEYSYETAGFDSFLSRSVDDLSQLNLDSSGPQTNTIRYDSSQVSGMLGDTLQVGQVHINRTNITFSDDNNNRLILGDDEGFA
jgi:hypothetical protein